MRRLGLGLAALLVLTGCGQHQKGFELSANLVADDVTLNWSGAPADAAYLMVEYATEEAGPYIILDFLPPSQHTFEHPDLMPGTTFYYRVTPLTAPAGEPAKAQPHKEDIQLTWHDTSVDEDGYLLERRTEAQPVQVAAYLDPNTTSFDLPLLPTDKPATYYPRPFRRGASSPITHETTPPE